MKSIYNVHDMNKCLNKSCKLEIKLTGINEINDPNDSIMLKNIQSKNLFFQVDD